MSKILSQSGVSLSDVYDVEGSIVGVEELDAEAVKTVHEMGGTIASERMSSRVLLLSTGAIAQDISFAVAFNVGPDINRILNVEVLADQARITHCNVCLADLAAPINDMPLWAWDTLVNGVQTIRSSVGGTLGNRLRLVPDQGITGPTMAMGTSQPLPTNQIQFRGVTSGFGAGTTVLSALIMMLFPQSASGLSNSGLPVPGW